MKEKRKYYFSVEGETEKLYLKRLQSIINNTLESQYNVDLYSKIEKDPCSYVKQLSIINKTKVTHIIDKESEIPSHKEEFKKNLDKMKEAEKLKKIEYQLAYSNFTFELWIILHKCNCFNPLNDRKEYLSYINKVYNKNFQSLRDYKKEENLKKILDELNIDDVIAAVKRAKLITEKNFQEKKEKKEKYRGYTFYNENPSLSVHKIIEQILKDCNLYK
ncbi:RloB domain-containing protein [Fusobacterium sp. oral taxon C10]